jgi:phytoene synthase
MVTKPKRYEPAETIALAWQPGTTRPALAALFDLDRRLATVVARAREPMLAQVRLAWWRERLAVHDPAAVAGEPLLAELATRWGVSIGKLAPLVDGLEHLLGEAPLDEAALYGFADGRGRAFAGFAELVGETAHHSAALTAGRSWAYADLAWRCSNARERDLARSLGRAEPETALRPHALRGLAVLGGLSRLALRRGAPLMDGRGAALAAIRLGLFGG